jgi:glucosamine--fructose-6-phosphate aminotransferase (isomerizing)
VCGITGGALKSDNIGEFIYNGLKRLEYRGYDSVGAAILSNGQLVVKKEKGKLDDVEPILKIKEMKGSVGIGHCLHPDTYVQLASGRICKISDVPQKFEVTALNPDLKFEVRSASVMRHLAPALLTKVKIASNEIVCSKEHRLAVTDENGNLVWKQAQSIRRGDHLVVASKLKIRGRSKRLVEVKTNLYYKVSHEIRARIKRKYSYSELMRITGLEHWFIESFLYAANRPVRCDVAEKILKATHIKGTSGMTPVIGKRAKSITFPEKTSSPLMQFVAYFIGDGSYNSNRCMRFKDADRNILKHYLNLCEQLFGITGRIVKLKDANAYYLELNSKILHDWLKLNFTDNLESFVESVGELPLQEITGFMRGLYDAEGGVGCKANQIFIGMTNQRIIRTLQFLLLRIGITASLYVEKKAEKNWSTSYHLNISNLSAFAAFQEKIGFTSKQKKKALARSMTKMNGSTFKLVFVPVAKTTLRKLLKENLGKLGEPLNAMTKGQGYMTKPSLEKMMKFLSAEKGASPIIEHVSKFLHSDVMFERVERVSTIRADTPYLYDIQVDTNENFIANCILSHNSRWATHGMPVKENAHPQTDCHERVAVVHNGIIENFQELRSELQAHGHTFSSRTDTEVVAHLVEAELDAGVNFTDAVRNAVRKLSGSYALAIVSSTEPDKVVCARKESPLVIGVSADGNYCASDVPAFLTKTRKVIFLNDDEMAVLTAGGVRVLKIESGMEVPCKVDEVEWSPETALKTGFSHFMLKEINEQAMSIKNAARFQQVFVDMMVSALDHAKDVYLVACGTSYHACVAASYVFSKIAKLPTFPVIASEFVDNYGEVIGPETVVLAVSQSGETSDTLNAVRAAKEKGATTLAITNVMGSTLTRLSGTYIGQNSGPEIGVAATKTFTSQLVMLIQLAVALAKKRGAISWVDMNRYDRAFKRLPALVSATISSQEPAVRRIVEKYWQEPSFVFLGRGINIATAMEGRLKLLELSYLPVIAYPAGESKHGFIAVVEEGYPLIFIAPKDETRQRIINNMIEMKSRGGRIIGLIPQNDAEALELVDDAILLPDNVLDILTPILYVIPLQLLAYHMAVKKGYDPDFPRNLAKSVTVP